MLDLPPVALPPPTGGQRRSASLAGRALLSVLLLAGIFVLAIGLVAAAVGVNVLVWEAGRVNLYLLLLPVGIAAAVAKGLIEALQAPPEPVDEVEVPPQSEPRLHEEVRQLAAAAGTRPPDRIVVIADVNAYVREFGRLLGLVRGTRTLAIGTPLLDTLDVSELRSVLAHELGHLSGGDTRLGPLTYRTDQVLVRTVRSLGDGAVARVFLAYWKFQRRVSAAVRRGQEVVADRASVRVAGRQAAADALRDIGVATVADASFKRSYLVPLLRSGHRPDDIVAGWRSMLGAERRITELARAVDEDRTPGDPWASHPPTHERIARIAAFADEAEVVRDTRPAAALFDHPDHWAHVATERWLSLTGVATPNLRVVPWSEWGQAVVKPQQANLATELDRVLTLLGLPRGLEGVIRAFATGKAPDVARELAAIGWTTRSNDRQRGLLIGATRAAAAAYAADNGARWALSWTDEVALLDEAGVPIDLDLLVARLVDGDWRPLVARLDGIDLDEDQARVEAEADDEARDEGDEEVEVDAPPGALAPIAAAAPTLAAPAPAPAAAIAEPAAVGPLPHPPTPPFAAAEGAWRWSARLPGGFGARVVIGVGEEHLALGLHVLPYGAIRSVSTRVRYLRGADATFVVTATDRAQPAQVTVRTANGSDVVKVVGYLWQVLGAKVAPRVVPALVAEVEAGREVRIGGLSLTSEGPAPAGAPAARVPWAQTAPARVEHLHLVVPTRGEPIRTSTGEPDAYLLLTLLPLLRRRFDAYAAATAATTGADAPA